MTVVIVAIDPYTSKSTLDVNEFLCKTLKNAYSGNWDEPNPRYMGVPRIFVLKSLLRGAFASWQDMLDEEAGYVQWPSLEWYCS
jgi:hypothetical protein